MPLNYQRCFIECRVGYIGTNCSEPCPYNSYGKGCQMTCNCIQDDCDFALGCKKNKPGICYLTRFQIISLSINVLKIIFPVNAFIQMQNIVIKNIQFVIIAILLFF